MSRMCKDDPSSVTVVEAIQTGDIQVLNRLLSENPNLATARIVENDHGVGCKNDRQERTLLHIVTDWPGHFPRGATTVAALIKAGADVNAQFTGPHTETPLHWAASSNDIEVLDALIEAGADIEAPGAVIAGGTPLDDAVAFGQWKAARRLVEYGAKTKLWHTAALGLMDRVKEHFAGRTLPTLNDVTIAFWQSCHGGQRRAAAYLLEQGADINWVGYDELTPLDTAYRSHADELTTWLRDQGAKSASELT